jgi:hypothetical protein
LGVLKRFLANARLSWIYSEPRSGIRSEGFQRLFLEPSLASLLETHTASNIFVNAASERSEWQYWAGSMDDGRDASNIWLCGS